MAIDVSRGRTIYCREKTFRLNWVRIQFNLSDVRDIADEIKRLVDAEEYAEAYELGLPVASDPEVLQALFYLTARLRHECIAMAVRKADSGEYYWAKDRLLRQVNQLTGEDMYGNRR